LFRLAMRNDKTHSLNRFLLLAILLVATVIPFLDFQFFYEEVPLKQVEVFREFVSTPVVTSDFAVSEIRQAQAESKVSYNPYLIFYISVILFLLIRLMVSIVRVMQIIGQAEKRKVSKIVLAIVKDLIQPFTFFNKIILSEKDFTENKDIVVAHEYAHIKQMHAIDLVVCELFTVVHFFNPFMWLLRRDLKLVHEYQADQAVLNKGIDAKKYQLLVLEKAVGERRFAMANHFKQKPILKRIKMMKMRNQNRWNGLKLIFFIPIVMLLLQAFSQPEVVTNIVADSKPFQYLIGMEYSDYSELGNFTKHSRSSITYPNGEKISAAKLVQGDKQIITSETTTLDEQTNLEVHKIQDIVVLNGYYTTCEGCLLPKKKINIILSIYSFGVIDDNSLLIAFERNIKTGKYKRVNPDNLERNSKYRTNAN